MNKVMLVLRKELKDIFQQRALIYSLCVVPLIIVVLSGFVLYKASSPGQAAVSGPNQGSGTDLQTQVDIGNLFRLYVLIEPLFIPAMIAAYSIVGEKNSKTLEPLLATPVETWQLMLGKSLSAILPAIIATWISGGIFMVEIAAITSPAAFAQVITSGWLVMLFLTAPVFTLTPVAIAIMTSSRLNDPRATAQISSLVFIALMLIFTTVGRSLVLSASLAVVIAIILAVVGIILLSMARSVFQREAILTRWK